MKEVLHVGIDDIPEGAELGADLEDDKGRMLMRQGTVLSADSIAALRKRNVARVQILAEEASDEAEIEARRQEILQRVEARFAAHHNNDLMQHLKAVVIAYRSEVLR